MADKEISQLPSTPAVTSETLIPVYQPGSASPAQKMTGAQFADFAREAAAADVQRAVDAAGEAEAAQQAAQKAAEEASAIRDTIIVDEEKLAQAVAQAAESAVQAERSEQNAGDSATLSESWAVGGTGTREGEDANNSKYWASVAQAEADRATVPAAVGMYNVILTDRVTGERYALIVEDGVLKLLGVSESLDAVELTLIDSASGTAYTVVIDDGKLAIEEV